MEGMLKVSPEQLTAAASEFSTVGTSVRNITQSMTELVTGISSTWAGDDSSAYVTKFNGLQDDIEKIHGMIQEHVADLNEMANAYSQASKTNQSEIESLSSDVIV